MSWWHSCEGDAQGDVTASVQPWTWPSLQHSKCTTIDWSTNDDQKAACLPQAGLDLLHNALYHRPSAYLYKRYDESDMKLV